MNKFNDIVHSIITETVNTGHFSVIDAALEGRAGTDTTKLWKPGKDLPGWVAAGATFNGKLFVDELRSTGIIRDGRNDEAEKFTFVEMAGFAIANPTLTSVEVVSGKKPLVVNLNLLRDFLKNSLGFIF